MEQESAGEVVAIEKNLLDSVNHLLETLNDKDEKVRVTVHSSLIRIAEKRPDDVLHILCDYKQKNAKLGEIQIVSILRVIEFITVSRTNNLKMITLQKCIELCVGELVRQSDHCPQIQQPAQEILVSIGRKHCNQVIDCLTKQLHSNQVPHFMIFYCLGTLSTANVSGTINFIKPILAVIIPTLAMIKTDHVKQAYSFAIGRFCEATTEHHLNSDKCNIEVATESLTSSDDGTGEEGDLEVSPPPVPAVIDISTELNMIYDVFINQWLQNREPKVCADILYALTNMFPLLSTDKIYEQTTKIIPSILNLYRRSIDRLAITQLLTMIITTIIKIQSAILNQFIDNLLISLFDLICVNPDYEKPQTIKGHYEVLRCFNILLPKYDLKVSEMLLIQLRSNNERDRIKSLLVLTHLTNTNYPYLEKKLDEFYEIILQMIKTEKMVKIKMILLKTIIAFIQKTNANNSHSIDFIEYILQNCCHPFKMNIEFGTKDEYNDFVQACNDSMFILSTTLNTMDNVLKNILLNYYMMYKYTDSCTTITKCLSTLFAKNSDVLVPINTKIDENGEEIIPDSEVISKGEKVSLQKPPTPLSIFVRSIILLGSIEEKKRIKNILGFLQNYTNNFYKHLTPLWNELIPHLIVEATRKSDDILDGTEDNHKNFYKQLNEFVTLTLKNIDDPIFNDNLIEELITQIPLYQNNATSTNQKIIMEYKTPHLILERCMLFKVLGLVLCYTSNKQLINDKVEYIINVVRLEKVADTKSLTSISNDSDAEHLIRNISLSLSYVAKSHYEMVIKHLELLVQQHDDIIKKLNSGNFFSNFKFSKEGANKDVELLKLRILIIQTFRFIIENVELIQNHDKIIEFLCKQLLDCKEEYLKSSILSIFLELSKIQLAKPVNNFKYRNDIINLTIKLIKTDNLVLFPRILQLLTSLMKIKQPYYEQINDTQQPIDVAELLQTTCTNFFSIAQNLKIKFESVEDDEKNSYLAQHLNLSLPELNLFIRAILVDESSNNVISSPACLDDITSILDEWIKNSNSEVRICAGHIMNNALEVYMKTVKIGGEAPSKFNQSGTMLGKIIPRCIDSNATVRQTSIEILRKILEITCIYDTLTIADSQMDWIQDLQKIRDEIITDDPKEIYKIAGELARIISIRISNYQYYPFCKTLLYSLNDPEISAAIGASLVLKVFVQLKGAEMFHAIPDFIKDSLNVLQFCEISRAKLSVLKSLLALTKHHPKLICKEMLEQPLPYEENVVEYWRTITIDNELSGIVLDNFLTILSSSCLYEQTAHSQHETVPYKDDKMPQIATIHPFSIVCAMHEMFLCLEIKPELKSRFADIFALLLTTLATYTNIAPPMNKVKPIVDDGQSTSQKSSKSNQSPNKLIVRMNPCAIAFETFKSFLDNLEMLEISSVLTINLKLTTSTSFTNFIELLTPLAYAMANQLSINSSSMKSVVTTLSKYISSPYDSQRLAAIGFYSQLVPLKPCGEISSVIMLHLNSALSDPNALVRGMGIRGMSHLGCLSDHDIDKYSEMCLAALLKGIDDYNNSCIINIPLESMLGLSKVLQGLPSDKLELFEISLAIRIRPFFENQANDIREAAIALFGDLCHQTHTAKDKQQMLDDGESNKSTESGSASEAMKEQLFINLFSVLLHLCETNTAINKACKKTLRNICSMLDAPKVNDMAQTHLLDYRQLHYDAFAIDFVRLIGEELFDHISDFIESCLPYLKSNWTEIRGNAAIVVGLLHNMRIAKNRIEIDRNNVSLKISHLLRDDQQIVKVKAAEALGYLFGDL